jgi:hypothetical protein
MRCDPKGVTRPSDESSETNELDKETQPRGAFIAFGFGIDRIVKVVSPSRHGSLGLSATGDCRLLALGINAFVGASLHYRRGIQSAHFDHQKWRDKKAGLC